MKISSYNLYPAIKDPTAPHGWKTSCNLYYQPSWGDRLTEKNGEFFIEIIQILPGS